LCRDSTTTLGCEGSESRPRCHIYGLAINDWPLIGSNAVTLALMAVILAAKLRYG
jgi:hypothetical protein